LSLALRFRARAVLIVEVACFSPNSWHYYILSRNIDTAAPLGAYFLVLSLHSLQAEVGAEAVQPPRVLQRIRV